MLWLELGNFQGGVAAVPHAFPTDPGLSGDIDNSLRTIAFRFGLAVIFLRFSLFQFVLTSTVHFNFYLLYIFGLPALLGVVVTGGLRRSFHGKPALYWTGYAVCMTLAVPFSIWKGGSAATVFGFLRADFPILLMIAGLGITWRECRAVFHTIALAAIASAVAGPLFQQDYGIGRTGMAIGTVADPNDYSAHLLLVLPFLLWEAAITKSMLVRLTALGFVGLGLVNILRSASRGGAVALAAAFLFFLFRASAAQRLVLVLLVPVCGVVFLASVPKTAMDRILAFAGSGSLTPLETSSAAESTRSRVYLLKKSIEYTLQFPVFGVGPGEFTEYEGQNNKVIGTHGLWHETHNTFTQVSSECGIPALIFFVAGLVSSFRLFNAVYRESRLRIGCEDIRNAAFYAMLGLFGFCAAISFLNFAYFFYLPAIGGLSILLSTSAREEMRARAGTGSNAPAVPMPWSPPPRRHPTFPTSSQIR